MSTFNNKNKKKTPQTENYNKSNSTNAWHTKDTNQQTTSKETKNATNKQNASKNKFKEAQMEHIQAAKKHFQNYETSSDEEDLESDALLESVFKGYDGDRSQLRKTQEFLEHVFQSGAATCLICIATVKRTDFIWSCENCFSFFHLNCLQRWAKDSISQQKMHQENDVGGYYNNQGEYIPKQVKAIKWCCPKCRADYPPSDIPQNYFCFCKKELNPANHLWLVPHSCGEVCGKPLKSACSHKCLILCHPGPCPPCSQIISTSCDCNKSNLKTIRCSQNSWKCGNKCSKILACGIHKCDQVCHKECAPCTKKSQQKCVCGNRVQERDCNSLIWSCEKMCNKLYACGRHRCKVKCHSGDCGECPSGLLRSCPCGKETTQAPCTLDVEPCGNTCQKILKCGSHICAERCHRGECGQCLEIVEKKCRCGNYSKELPCSKTFLCEAKCKRMRDCNKHACNRKCCDGDCSPCDKICGKTLSCGKHKCTSVCHHGQCYPCTLTATVKCRCGNTSMDVPCGREKKTKPPKCNLPCKIPSKCHHNNVHNCHMNECPSCNNICMLTNDVTNCEHPCRAKCHDAVKVLVVDKNFKPAGPWDIQPEKYEIRKLPHPKCEVKVPVECIGGHELALWPCWNSKPASCGRNCGRTLKCGNHLCEQMCHIVDDKTSKMQDKSCAECLEGCQVPRPPGCCHSCEKRCHPKPCNPCNVVTKTACHCGLNQVYYKCHEFYGENQHDNEVKENREKRLSCGNRCIKNFSCGHRCTNVCHSGKCLNEESCRKKLKVYCECKNRKVETTCDKLRSGFILGCDDTCRSRQEETKRVAEQQERIKRQQEEEKNRIELEEFEKKFGKKKYKERKAQIIEDTDNSHLYKWAGLVAAGAILAGFIYYLFAQ
ncbi:NF-X1-type zinc finger protein NFXL1 isoform X1 [Contarinia nasturtii]|uniref:NF-X1-type zinc finger protein NFXL1 isoform X1 n=1 Tax=Contarinia nasturtii TaxID=265458 RepID=UPI0012D3C7C7|nr:NF-X1-type zinc finger protein NFXL1 isoform X1 [Contarinia nasturtii]